MTPGARRITGMLLGLSAVAAAAIWALAPLEDGPDLLAASTSPVGGLGDPVAAEPDLLPPLDLAAFRTPLWVAPPPPPPPVIAQGEPPPPPPPPPIKLQLLAIVREADGTYRALVYDSETDALLALAEGEKVGPRTTVESVSAGELRLRDARGVRALALRDDPKGGAP